MAEKKNAWRRAAESDARAPAPAGAPAPDTARPDAAKIDAAPDDLVRAAAPAQGADAADAAVSAAEENIAARTTESDAAAQDVAEESAVEENVAASETGSDPAAKDFASPAQQLADRLTAAMAAGARRALAGLRAAPPVLRRLARGLWLWLGAAFYEVGYHTEYAFVLFGRAVRRTAPKAARGALRALWWLLRVVLWLPVAILMLPGRILWHIGSALHNVWRIWYTRDPDHPLRTWRDTFAYLGGGLYRHSHLVLELLGWVLPVAAAALFVFTVRTVLSYTYVLQVSYDDQVLGYVASEDVFESARQDVRARIVYTGEDDGAQWDMRPVYTLAVNDGLTVMDADDVADAILLSSGEEITEATGFYLDGQFYGAVTQRAALEEALAAIKAPYYTGEEGESVSFVVEPELVDGVYLRSSVVEFAIIDELIHGEVAGEVRYTVSSGDTPSGIAHAYGLTVAELQSMNPQSDILNHLYPGDSLVVSQAVSFLQVQQTYRRTEMEEVPYQTVRTNTSDLSFGFTRVSRAGVNGLNECVYDYVYIDGVLQSKTLVSTTVVSEPVTEEILVGTQVRPGVTMIPATGGYMWPVPATHGLSRGFSAWHDGMDILAYYGAPIYAAQSGVVTTAVYTDRGYGIYVVIDHGGGYSTLYGHCSSLAVSAGDLVNQGDLIAYMGSSGNSTGPHCHFEIRINGVRIDPAPYVGSP